MKGVTIKEGKMKLKKIVSIFMVAVLTVSIVGCGDNKKGGEVTKKEGKNLVIYTNSGSNGRDKYLKEKAKEAGFDVEVVSIQGGELANRIIAEKNNVQADLIYGLNSVEYERLKAEDTLVKYKPEWSKDVDMSLGDEEGYYYPIVIQPLVNIMKNDLSEYPESFKDLTDPKWNGKYHIMNFGGGTGRSILASLLVQYKDPDGELGVSKEGWEFVKKFIQNGKIAKQGEDWIGAVINGNVPICQMWGSGVLQYEKERNYKFKLMVPSTGVPYVTEQVAVVKGGKTDEAIKFANWFGTSKIQEDWMKQFGTIPCQPEALKNATPEIKEFMSKVKKQDIDWKFVTKYIDKWVEKVELEFVK